MEWFFEKLWRSPMHFIPLPLSQARASLVFTPWPKPKQLCGWLIRCHGDWSTLFLAPPQRLLNGTTVPQPHCLHPKACSYSMHFPNSTPSVVLKFEWTIITFKVLQSTKQSVWNLKPSFGSSKWDCWTKVPHSPDFKCIASVSLTLKNSFISCSEIDVFGPER